MEIPKDLYDYLTKFADDKTILQMISVNKKYNDPVFFEKIMMRKYPLLIRYKRPNESEKSLYLRMIFSISKLQEEFQISYENITSTDPFKFYNEMRLLSEMLYQLKILPPPEYPEDNPDNQITIYFIENNSTIETGRIYIDKESNDIVNVRTEMVNQPVTNISFNRIPKVNEIFHLLLNQKIFYMELWNGAEGVMQFIVNNYFPPN